MIAYPEDGGDIRQGGGRNAPTTPAPRVLRKPLLRMVHHAQTMGLSVADALAGTGITPKQFKEIATWGGAKKRAQP